MRKGGFRSFGSSRFIFTVELGLIFGVGRWGGVEAVFLKSLSPVPKFLLLSLDDSHPHGREGLTQCGAQRDMHEWMDVSFGLAKFGFLAVG